MSGLPGARRPRNRPRPYLSRYVPPSPFLRPRRFAPPSTPAPVSRSNTRGVGLALQGLPDPRGPRRHRRRHPLVAFSAPVLPPQSLSLIPLRRASRGLLCAPSRSSKPNRPSSPAFGFPSAGIRSLMGFSCWDHHPERQGPRHVFRTVKEHRDDAPKGGAALTRGTLSRGHQPRNGGDGRRTRKGD